MLNNIVFSDKSTQYKIAILIKDQAMRAKELRDHYVEPLIRNGFKESEIVAFNLAYNEEKKAPVKLIKEHLARVVPALEKLGISHVLVADAAYFKVFCKLKKAEPYFGYSMPSIYAHIRAALTVNYTQLFFNPSLKSRLRMGVDAISKDFFKEDPLFKEDKMQNIKFPSTYPEIQNTLEKLLEYPALTCDIETLGLHLKHSEIVSIAFAWDEHSGVSFMVLYSKNKPEEIHNLLRKFFERYEGKLIFHNAPFDTKVLTFRLFMKDVDDMQGMLTGLDYLYRDLDDTMTLTYLATNNTAENKLSLKDQAFEFAGNYALGDELTNIASISPEDLLNYNVTDTLATWFVYNKHRDTVREEQEEIYQQLFRPALKVLTQTELCGMPMDLSKIQNIRTQLQHIADKHKLAIKTNPIIKQFENELKLWTAVEATAKLKKKKKTAADFDFLEFNTRSSKHIRKLLYESLNLPVFRRTDTGLPSTDAKTLQSLISHLEKTYNL
jgi:DNA polymerase-1